MDVSKVLAVGLAANRIVYGAGNLVRPEQARWSWIGRAAKKPGARVMIRSQGARDLALGAGAVQAAARGEAAELRAWMLAHVVADATDFAATLAARDDLPKRRARFAITVAAASTAIGAAAAATSRAPRAGGTALGA